MKKVLLVLAIVAVYGFSISSVSAKNVVVDEVTVTVVADDNVKAEAEKEKPAAKKAAAKGAACGEKAEVKTEAKAGCGEAQKAACGTAAKSSCCGGEKKAEGGK